MDPNAILRSALEKDEILAIEALLLLQQDRTLFPEIYSVANEVSKRLHKGTVTYSHERVISYTTSCRCSSKLCNYQRRKNERPGTLLSIDDILNRVKQSPDVTGVTLQGGLNPEVPFAFLLDLVKEVQAAFPNLTLTAFSPAEVAFYAKRARVSAFEAIRKLREAGLTSMSGNAADILNDKVRKKISPDRLRTGDWVEIVKCAHRNGIRTSASMVFGHVENEIHICEHIELIRTLQKETGGFTEFVFYPYLVDADNARLVGEQDQVDWDEIFRIMAVARIFFGALLPNLSASWVHHGLPNSIRATGVGTNDVGHTIYDDGLSHYTRNTRVDAVTPDELDKAIRKAGRVPKRRDAFYNDSVPVRKKGSSRVAAAAVR